MAINNVINNNAITAVSGTANQVVSTPSGKAVTLSLPASVQISTGILDSNANPILALSATASSVNYAQILNNATGFGPYLAAVGTDASIDVSITPKGAGAVSIQSMGGTPGNGRLKIWNAASTAYVSIASPTSPTTYDTVLPAVQGAAGTVMQNNGSGVLSWVANGGAQGILQVVQTTLNTTFASTGATDFTDITGLSLSITPISASSRILILANVVMRGNVTQTFPLARLVRGGTALFVGSGGTLANGSGGANAGLSSTGGSVSFNYVDSPASTSALTYKLQGVASSAIALGDFDVNIVRSSTSVGSSSIIAIEIAS
jgi:hypothetical protein